MQTIYDISLKTIKGESTTLAALKGKYLLIVNVASQCGFTPQYEGLEQLSKEFKDKLEVLGFPCNQFGAQEPGTADEIIDFCSSKFNVSFPLFEKIEVNGPNAHPLYQHLKGEKPGVLGTEAIKWNFTKFLVGPDGAVIKRYAPQTTPTQIGLELQKLLTV